jgi:hypothetical protein
VCAVHRLVLRVFIAVIHCGMNIHLLYVINLFIFGSESSEGWKLIVDKSRRFMKL